MNAWGEPATSKAGTENGFTLLEVLVALALMGIAVTLIIQLFAAGTRALSASEDYLAASLAGEVRLRELIDSANFAEAAWQEVDKDGRRIDVSIAETLQDRTDGLSVRVFDVSVTLRWMWGAKNRQITLRTLKTVDTAEPGAETRPSGA